ncbi:MAG: glycosyltransferase family 2 protein, partial [Cellulosilyticaceae bacterium]
NLLGWTKKRGDGKSVVGFNTVKRVFSACAGAALYRKEVFEQIGYFDEHFFAYMEDVDIGYRANIYGYKNVYCPTAKVYHIGSATSGSRHNAFKVKLAARNNIYVAYKNMPLLQLILNFPFLLMGYSIKYFFFRSKGLGKSYKEGILEGINTMQELQKTPFRWNHIKEYFYIEGQLIKNLVLFFVNKG